MINGLFLFLTLLLPLAHAAVTTTADFASPSLSTLADFQDIFQEQGLWSVDAQNTGAASVFQVDQIFTDAVFDETVYLKLGLQQFPQSSFNTIAKGLAYQGKTTDGIPYVLFFEHIPAAKARKLVASLHPSSKTSRAALFSLLIPKARADCGVGTVQSSATAAMGDLGGILGFRSLATCAITALEAGGKTVAGPLEALAQFVQDPSKFWESAQKDWQKFKDFVLNVRDEMSKFFHEIGQLDAEVAEQIGCTVIGHVAAAAAVTALTGGLAAGAAAKTSAALALMISKLNGLKSVLRAISTAKQFLKLKITGALTRQVMSCATH